MSWFVYRALVPALLAALAALPGSSPASAGAEHSAPAAKTVLAIEGMTCGGCVAAVKSALKKTEGVTAYEVSLEKKEAEVRFDPRKTDPGKIAAAVSKTGFKATVKGEPGSSKGR